MEKFLVAPAGEWLAGMATGDLGVILRGARYGGIRRNRKTGRPL